MTKAAKKALQSVGVPAVRLHASGQFYCRIGYRQSASGKRQRAFFYLGDDEKAAVAKAAALKAAWRARRKLSKRAVWPSNTLPPSMKGMSNAEVEAELQRLHDEQSIAAIEGGDWQQPTIAQVRGKYLRYRKGKVGIGGGEGIKESTYSNDADNLRRTCGYIDASQSITSLTYAALEQWKDQVFRRVNNGLTKRTAVNYMRSVKGMLEWAHREQSISYRHPEDFTDLFAYRVKAPIKIAEYDAEQLKTLLSKATERSRLYVYLALNCGYTQVDIANLRQSEIITYNGKAAICRRRDKTSHQNDFEALHTLWPETLELLKRQKAGPNPMNLALVNEMGKPLYERTEHRIYDAISDAHAHLCKRSKVHLPFKQFRKIGSTAIQRLGGDEARRLYKAGAIDSGDNVYVIEAWGKLTPYLDSWAYELRRDGVLTLPPQKPQQPQ